MRVMVFGANGQVGRALCKYLLSTGVDVRGLSRDHNGGDILQLADVEAAISQYQPNVIVNAAAFTNVDLAESQVEEAYAVNEAAVANLVRCAKAVGALLVHFSTDFVFDGIDEHPWGEEDRPNPLNAYGRSKLAGEKAVVQSGCRYVVLRVSWVHAPGHKNFITSAMDWLKEKNSVRVVHDQWGSPTSANDIAWAVKAVIDRAMRDSSVDGIYHFANEGFTTRFDCVRFIASQLHSRSNVELVPVSSSTFKLPAQRPLNCRLDTGKFKRTFGYIARSWQDGVRETIFGK